MQPNFSNNNNKSHLIKITETKTKRARRRLIGSVFLLIISLIFLLKVTSRVTPIDQVQKPVQVEIKNTSSSVIASSPSVASTIQNTASKPVSSSPTIDTNRTIVDTKLENTTPKKQNIINEASTPATHKSTSNTSYPVKVLNNSNALDSSKGPAIKPKLITETIKPVTSPEDILNGGVPSPAKNRYYIQLLSSVDKDKLIDMQNIIANKGFKTVIQSVDTTGGTVYRLRVGPFSDQDEAQSIIKNINAMISDE